jgi:hypothetical protein
MHSLKGIGDDGILGANLWVSFAFVRVIYRLIYFMERSIGVVMWIVDIMLRLYPETHSTSTTVLNVGIFENKSCAERILNIIHLRSQNS